MSNLLPFESLKTAEKTNFTVIWLHGLGADGNDFVPIVPELRLPESLEVKFIFPHAPVRAITLNNGHQMPAWFDMTSLDRENNAKEDDILTTVGWINKFIDQEIAEGTASENIVLAGFSQGGVIALHAGLRYPKRLAGIMALSTYLPFDERLFNKSNEVQKALPVFAVHGKHDPVIPLASLQSYVPKLEVQGYMVETHQYEMEHSVCAEEIADISKWLQRVLGQK